MCCLCRKYKHFIHRSVRISWDWGPCPPGHFSPLPLVATDSFPHGAPDISLRGSYTFLFRQSQYENMIIATRWSAKQTISPHFGRFQFALPHICICPDSLRSVLAVFIYDLRKHNCNNQQFVILTKAGRCQTVVRLTFPVPEDTFPTLSSNWDIQYLLKDLVCIPQGKGPFLSESPVLLTKALSMLMSRDFNDCIKLLLTYCYLI